MPRQWKRKTARGVSADIFLKHLMRSQRRASRSDQWQRNMGNWADTANHCKSWWKSKRKKKQQCKTEYLRKKERQEKERETCQNNVENKCWRFWDLRWQKPLHCLYGVIWQLKAKWSLGKIHPMQSFSPQSLHFRATNINKHGESD